ncbi:uncharacterized protein PHACADRAFT_211831 [Phanerochaete carnosa HHB-10118-sp]|uniref:CHAT domain-containing protein n=1 Tax=Phanerochaete carnosa (strain HHB-10118-sp) TaxID=650164 RepID=K5URR9_PHACS|nr:uncharacterized protein PHACADRAFT_211831 [Phanerochaete carnosa HHB-10118-sp]EKM52591.1 hypothetical protein PHACADRAFT_211831 [Phanerochaete carnosa HHB-10118-sp]
MLREGLKNLQPSLISDVPPPGEDNTTITTHVALSHEPSIGVNRVTLPTTLPSTLCTRLARAHNPRGIEDAITAVQEAISLSPTGEPDATLLYTLAELLLHRFELRGQPTDMAEALSLHHKTLLLSPLGHPERYHSLLSLAKASHTHFCYASKYQDLTDAIEFGCLALSLFDPTCHDQPTFFTTVAALMLSSFKHTCLSPELDQCIEHAQEAVSHCSPESPARHASLDILSRSLLSRYRERGKPSDLEVAIEYAQEAVSLCLTGHLDRARALVAMATGLLVRSERTGDPGDLQQSASPSRDALELCSPEIPALLNTLVPALIAISARESERSGLETCIELGNQALTLCPLGHLDRPHPLINLAVAQLARFEFAGRQEDIDNSITSLREAIGLLPSGAVVRAVALEREDLIKNIDYAYEALSLCPPRHSYRTSIVGHLPKTLLQQSWTDGNSSIRPELISTLADALLDRFMPTGLPDDLTDCVLYGYKALSLRTGGHSRRPRILAGLSFYHNESRQLEGLNSSISFLREALSLETKDPEDLEKFMLYTEEALRLCPLEQFFLYDSASCYMQRYKQAGEHGDLDKGIDCYQEVLSDVSLYPDQSPIHQGLLLSIALLERHRALGRMEDLDECIDLAQRALSSYSPELSHLGRGRSLCVLTSALSLRYSSTGNKADISDAIMHERELAVSELGLDCLQRLRTAMHWATMAHNQDHPSTLEAYRLSLELLERNFVYFPTLGMQHDAVREVKSLPSNAAAYAIGQGDLKLAVEMLEQGRALLWSHVRRLRTPLDQLAVDEDLIHLRDTFLRKSRALEALNISANPFIRGSAIGEGDGSYGHMLEMKHRLTAELNGVIERIRVKFPNFLKPPSYDKLKAASAEGPVIIVNHSEYRSDALILGPGDSLSCVQLSDIFYDQAVELSDKLLKMRQVLLRSAQKEYDRVLRLMLKSLGNLLVVPVMEKLKELGVKKGSRIWWYPTSVVSALPLHAAGPLKMPDSKSSKSKVYLPDIYIPSYTPTLAALIEARAAPAGGYRLVERAGLLGVALLDQSLQAVGKEVEVLRSRFPEGKLTLAIGSGCNRETVVAGLAERPWVHFACHGTLEARDPFNSALILSGGERLTLLDIVKAGLHSAELAVLSACHTAEQTQDSAMDESLHLAAAMQFSGFRSVVGTVWQLQDDDGPMFADYFYRAIFAEKDDEDATHASEVGFKKAARALCSATKEMRRRKVSVERWVNFVHIGA